jgi:membrane-bound lytic murein transglycosylase A
MRRWAALGLALLAAGCAGPGVRTPSARLVPVSYSELAGWQRDRQDEALAAFMAGCPQLGGAWRDACRAAAGVPRDDAIAARRFFETWFVPHRVETAQPTGLFTGYYVPVLRGSLRRHGRYTVPIHGPPLDHSHRRVYASRAQILRNPYDRRLPVVVWVDDPVDVFTLHIQGSGIVRLAEGGIMRIGVTATNNQPYVSIGKVLVEMGALQPQDATMQGIRAWLHTHPHRAAAVMNRNPRYIFFRRIDGPGPIGSLGAVLTPLRSLAVDPRYVPLGAPVWLEASWPTPPGGPLRRLVVAQDTGEAIKGPVRGDLYAGAGEAALDIAGRMAQTGSYFVLLPKGMRFTPPR